MQLSLHKIVLVLNKTIYNSYWHLGLFKHDFALIIFSVLYVLHELLLYVSEYRNLHFVWLDSVNYSRPECTVIGVR